MALPDILQSFQVLDPKWLREHTAEAPVENKQDELFTQLESEI